MGKGSTSSALKRLEKYVELELGENFKSFGIHG